MNFNGLHSWNGKVYYQLAKVTEVDEIVGYSNFYYWKCTVELYDSEIKFSVYTLTLSTSDYYQSQMTAPLVNFD